MEHMDRFKLSILRLEAGEKFVNERSCGWGREAKDWSDWNKRNISIKPN